jgi:proteic killer suppression protein
MAVERRNLLIITVGVINELRYYFDCVIKSFRDRKTEEVWRAGRTRGSPAANVTKRKLAMLDAALQLNDLKLPPGNRLQRLRGDRQGQHSIRINDQYRVCLVWRGHDAYDVEIVDYH